MKQPKNSIVIDWDGEWAGVQINDIDEFNCIFVEIAVGVSKRTALKCAIRRLRRLQLDAEKMLDKLPDPKLERVRGQWA